jgi:hypothetical protein
MHMDVYAHWRERLKTGAELGTPGLPYLPGTSHDEPQPGLYRVREMKGGPLVPMQIWLVNQDGATMHTWDDGLELRGTIAGLKSSVANLGQRWMWAHPVSKADKAHFDEHGHWPDDIPKIGDNSGNVTPLEELQDYIEQAVKWIDGREIKDAQTANQAGNYVGKIAALRLAIDKEREAKVRPHLDAQQQINGEYNPLIKTAKDLETKIKRAMDTFAATEKRRLEAEARAKYEAEQKRIAEERAAYLAANPIAEYTEPEPELPMAPEPVKVALGGAHGNRITLRSVTEYVLVDYDAVVQALKNNPKVIEVITSVAKAQAKAGVVIPGIEARQVERVA